MIPAEQLDALERRYTPADGQKCVVCGAPLAFSASGEGGGSRYNCSSDDASPVRSTRPLHERLDHYAGSAWRDRGIADSGVVELVRAYRELAGGRAAAAKRPESGQVREEPCPQCGGQVTYQFGNWYCTRPGGPGCGWSTARDVSGPNGGRVTLEHCPSCGGKVIYNGNYFCERWDYGCDWALPGAGDIRKKADREIARHLFGEVP
jgi:rRNA maturation protein Nop10